MRLMLLFTVIVLAALASLPLFGQNQPPAGGPVIVIDPGDGDPVPPFKGWTKPDGPEQKLFYAEWKTTCEADKPVVFGNMGVARRWFYQVGGTAMILRTKDGREESIQRLVMIIKKDGIERKVRVDLFDEGFVPDWQIDDVPLWTSGKAQLYDWPAELEGAILSIKVNGRRRERRSEVDWIRIEHNKQVDTDKCN